MSELLVIGNPARRKRKRSHARRRSKSRRRHVARRRTHTRARRRSTFRVRARRNPVMSLGGVMGSVKAGAVGAVGGLANDMLYGFAASKLSFLPADGIPRYLAKLGTALVIGKVGGMVARGKGGALGAGAVTCVLHDALREQVKSMSFLQQFNLGEYIEEPAALMHGYDAGMPVEGVDGDDGLMGDGDEMGEYIEQ